jgi:hypothetical protein
VFFVSGGILYYARLGEARIRTAFRFYFPREPPPPQHSISPPRTLCLSVEGMRTARLTAGGRPTGAAAATARPPTRRRFLLLPPTTTTTLFLLSLLLLSLRPAAAQNGPDDDWRAYLPSGWETRPQFRDPDRRGHPYCGPCRFFDPAADGGVGACRYWAACAPSGQGSGGRNCGACFAFVNDNALGHCERVDVACG